MSRRIVVVCTSVTLVLGACGGGDSGPSDADFRKAVAEPCETFNDEREDLDRATDDGESGFRAKYADLLEDLADDLAELEASSDLEESLDDLRGVVDDAAETFRDIEDAVDEVDTDAFFDLVEDMDAHALDAEDVAEDLDVDECALDLGLDLFGADGDEDQGDTDVDDTDSADGFRAGLDAVCDSIAAQVAELVPPTSDTDFAGLETFMFATRDLLADALDELEDLVPPADQEDIYEDFLDVLDRQIEMVEDIGRAAENEDPAEIRALQLELETLSLESDELADEFELDRCASGG